MPALCVTAMYAWLSFGALYMCVSFVELRMRIEYTRWERVSATDHFKCQWTLNIFQTTLYARLYSFSLSLALIHRGARALSFPMRICFIQYYSCSSFYYFISLYFHRFDLSFSIRSYFFLQTIELNVWFIQKWSTTHREISSSNLQFQPISLSCIHTHTIVTIIVNIKNRPNFF